MLDQIIVVALTAITLAFLTRRHPRPDTTPATEEREWVGAWDEPVKGDTSAKAMSDEECTDYSTYTVRQLRKQIAQVGAKIPHNATKANLIKVLQSM